MVTSNRLFNNIPLTTLVTTSTLAFSKLLYVKSSQFSFHTLSNFISIHIPMTNLTFEIPHDPDFTMGKGNFNANLDTHTCTTFQSLYNK